MFLVLVSVCSFAQDNSNKLKITGESLKGKTIDGESIREVIGNVVITQEDVRITCDKAIQYIASNNAKLVGNVIIRQDSVTIKTESGRYFGDLKIAYGDSAVHLNKGVLDLHADKGNYNMNTKTANFFGNVVVKDSASQLTSTKLEYIKDLEKMIAVGNVIVTDSLSLIKADSLIHQRDTKFSEGFRNIEIINKENNLTIFGKHLLDDKGMNISKISGNPFLTQIEELSDGTFDTLFIKSKYMEARKDSSSGLFAIDSVEIVRGNFSSVNDYTIYDQDIESIVIIKQEDKKIPVIWYENNQVVGDSILIKLDSSRINNVDIIENAIMISQDSTYEFRFNQMSGDSIHLYFDKSKLKKTDVKGNVLSIYYLFEEKEPNGLLKSSAKEIIINLDSNRVSGVKMFGSPITEYHPENLVKGSEKSFTLPTFLLYNNRPKKENFRIKFLKNRLN